MRPVGMLTGMGMVAARRFTLILIIGLAAPAAASDAPPRGREAVAALRAYDKALSDAETAYVAGPAGAERDAAYERAVTAAREALAAGLEQAKKAATDAGATGEAQAITAAIAEWAVGSETPPLEARERLAAARRVLLGTWKIETGTARAVWTFLPGGVMRSDQVSFDGAWRIAPARVIITWGDNPAWDSFDLPLDPEGSSGSTHVGPDVECTATKIAELPREPLALQPAKPSELPNPALDPALLAAPAGPPPAFRQPMDEARFRERFDALLAELGGVEALAKVEGPACGERIFGVDEGTQAEVLGLQPGDVVTTIDGEYSVGATGFRRLRKDQPQAMTVVRGGETHTLQIQPGRIGFDAEPIFRPELVYIRGGTRDPKWDAYAAVGCAAALTDTNLAEAAWAKALDAGYGPDFISDYCGMLIAFEQGRVGDAVAYAASLETRDGEFPELNKAEYVSRVAVADFKLEQALARRMRPNPGPRRVEGARGDVLERMLELHRSLPPARRTGASPSALAETGFRESLLERMEATKGEVRGVQQSRPHVVQWFATNPEPLHDSAPTGHYYTHVQVPTVNAPDVELIAHVTFRETSDDWDEWDKVFKIGLVSADQPQFANITAPVSPNLISLSFSLPPPGTSEAGVCQLQAGSEEGQEIQSVHFDVGRAARDGVTVRIVHAGEREEVWLDGRRIAYVPSLERPRRVGFMFALVGVDLRIGVKFNKLAKR